MPVSNYEDVFAGYTQSPGAMSGSQVYAVDAGIVTPGISASGGVQAAAPRVAALLLGSLAVLAALKISGIRFNVGT